MMVVNQPMELEYSSPTDARYVDWEEFKSAPVHSDASITPRISVAKNSITKNNNSRKKKKERKKERRKEKKKRERKISKEFFETFLKFLLLSLVGCLAGQWRHLRRWLAASAASAASAVVSAEKKNRKTRKTPRKKYPRLKNGARAKECRLKPSHTEKNHSSSPARHSVRTECPPAPITARLPPSPASLRHYPPPPSQRSPFHTSNRDPSDAPDGFIPSLSFIPFYKALRSRRQNINKMEGRKNRKNRNWNLKMGKGKKNRLPPLRLIFYLTGGGGRVDGGWTEGGGRRTEWDKLDTG